MTTTLDALDDAADRLLSPAALPRASDMPQDYLPNGTYTLVFPSGEHRTFRVRTERKNAFRGRRTIGLLIGPDNTDEYESFAFVNDDGIGVWQRFRSGPFSPSKQQQYAAILWDLTHGEELDGYELRVAKRCMRCNRLLTTPESIEIGFGPECATR
jgi:hypothetical protein